MSNSYDRRDFLKTVGATGLTLEAAKSALASKSATKATGGRVIGANDRINVGVIGVRRPAAAMSPESFAQHGDKHDNACQIVAVCDVYEKRKRDMAERLQVRRLSGLPRGARAARYRRRHRRHARPLARQESRSTPWTTARTSTSKSRCATPSRKPRQLVNTVKETKRVLQVGSQTTSGDQWWKAQARPSPTALIGQMIMSQGSYHRNSIEGEWNWPIDAGCRPGRQGRQLHRLEDVAGLESKRAPSAPSTPTASSASASIGITPAASPPTCSITWWRRSTSAGASRSFPSQGHGHRRHLRVQGRSARCRTPST